MVLLDRVYLRKSLGLRLTNSPSLIDCLLYLKFLRNIHEVSSLSFIVIFMTATPLSLHTACPSTPPAASLQTAFYLTSLCCSLSFYPSQVLTHAYIIKALAGCWLDNYKVVRILLMYLYRTYPDADYTWGPFSGWCVKTLSGCWKAPSLTAVLSKLCYRFTLVFSSSFELFAFKRASILKILRPDSIHFSCILYCCYSCRRINSLNHWLTHFFSLIPLL